MGRATLKEHLKDTMPSTLRLRVVTRESDGMMRTKTIPVAIADARWYGGTRLE